MKEPLSNHLILVTGITDSNSLAMTCAKQILNEGGKIICTGLGKTKFHKNLSEKSEAFLDRTYNDFEQVIQKEFGKEIITLPMDVTIEESIGEVTEFLKSKSLSLNGFLHSIAMDKTIRAGAVKPILEVTKDEFFSAMEVSAYSLIAMSRSFIQANVISNNASIVSLSYLGAEKIVRHPYKNVGVAKAALERITFELAYELGKSHGIKVNSIRFSPFTGSKAGGAIQGLQEAYELCEKDAPLGNARPIDLAYEVAYLLRNDLKVTGEIRYVDGGYNIRG
ncbi:MAG: SDR family oxidoreductase [Leptospiraceae bacterium]|nr:SDR family oxidoreductase [Leptospiraceae bacterium]